MKDFEKENFTNLTFFLELFILFGSSNNANV